jgi:hypothetical protein
MSRFITFIRNGRNRLINYNTVLSITRVETKIIILYNAPVCGNNALFRELDYFDTEEEALIVYHNIMNQVKELQ